MLLLLLCHSQGYPLCSNAPQMSLSSWSHKTPESPMSDGDKLSEVDIGAQDVEEWPEIVATQPVEGHVLTPDWVKDAVFYHIFPDRFATSIRVEKPPTLEPWEAPPTTHG